MGTLVKNELRKCHIDVKLGPETQVKKRNMP